MSLQPVFTQGPSQLARRRLRIAQQAYRAAATLSQINGADADRVMSVVQFYFSIETVLRAALFEAKHKNARSESFRELLNAVGDVLCEQGAARQVPGRGGLEQVQSVRKAAQHEARVPTPAEVTEGAVHTRDSLFDLAQLLWNVDFLASDIDAVQSEQVRKYLQRAVDSKADDDLHAAMGWLRASFEYAFRHAGENIVGPAVDVREVMVRTSMSRHDRPDPFHSGEKMAVALRRIQILGRLSAFSISVPDYLHWRNRFAAAPALNMRDEVGRYEKGCGEWSIDDFNSGLAYVVDSVIKMEDIVGGIDSGGFVRGGFDKL